MHGSCDGADVLGDVGKRSPSFWMPTLPFELNQDRRLHIPDQRDDGTNWPACNARMDKLEQRSRRMCLPRVVHDTFWREASARF